jgi:hypothetical protein
MLETFSQEQRTRIMEAACESPEASGRPATPWTPREWAQEVINRGLGAPLSYRAVCETSRQALAWHQDGVQTIGTDEETCRHALERVHLPRPVQPGLIERWETEKIYT